jgi:3,4-dihydroxy 2-butanone 4-phosphate synthase/GTP cyclohydrolase II
VICEILKPDGTMARLPDLIEYSREHQLKIGTIADLIQYRSEHESVVERVAQRSITTPWGAFELTVYRDTVDGRPHMALVKGQIDRETETLVRVHEPTTLLDLLDTDSPGHTWGVDRAMKAIAAAPVGVIVLLNADPLAADVFAQVQTWSGENDAKPARKAGRMDLRTYGIGAQILRDLGVGQMRLMARPRKMPSMLPGFGLAVTGYDESFAVNNPPQEIE